MASNSTFSAAEVDGFMNKLGKVNLTSLKQDARECDICKTRFSSSSSSSSSSSPLLPGADADADAASSPSCLPSTNPIGLAANALSHNTQEPPPANNKQQSVGNNNDDDDDDDDVDDDEDIDVELETPVRLACGHVYGEKCLKRWISGKGIGNLPTCPMCRAVLDTTSVNIAESEIRINLDRVGALSYM